MVACDSPGLGSRSRASVVVRLVLVTKWWFKILTSIVVGSASEAGDSEIDWISRVNYMMVLSTLV